MIGFAVTARIAALSPLTKDTATIRARRLVYYRAMAEARQPAVAVIEDTDFPACVGAFRGVVNTTIHKGFGLAGA